MKVHLSEQFVILVNHQLKFVIIVNYSTTVGLSLIKKTSCLHSTSSSIKSIPHWSKPIHVLSTIIFLRIFVFIVASNHHCSLIRTWQIDDTNHIAQYFIMVWDFHTKNVLLLAERMTVVSFITPSRMCLEHVVKGSVLLVLLVHSYCP